MCGKGEIGIYNFEHFEFLYIHIYAFLDQLTFRYVLLLIVDCLRLLNYC